jgi:hypothetical protein
MIVHNMVTRASMVVDARPNHEVIADLSPIGIDGGMISLQFLAKPWSVDGKPSTTPAQHKPHDYKTKLYQLIGEQFYPIPYAGTKDGKMVLLIASSDDHPIEAIEAVLEDVKEMLYGYFFFDTVKQDIIDGLGI